MASLVFGAALAIGQTTSLQLRYYYAIENLNAGVVTRRGVTSFSGNDQNQVILAPNTLYRQWLLEADTGRVGFTDFTTPSSGQRFAVQPIPLRLPSTPDTDGDGLSDDAEFIVGSNPLKADTDGDGIKDGAAIQLGLDPVAAARTGIIGTVATSGVTVDVCAFNDIVVTANTDAGISVFNVFNRMVPIIIAQVDTPGTATAVACSGNLIAVADGAAGLAIIDITDPPNARIMKQVDANGTVQAVATAGEFAIVGTRQGEVLMLLIDSGEILQRLNLGGTVEDLAIEGDTLYAYANGQLQVLPFGVGLLQVAGTIPSPGGVNTANGRGRIFVGGDIAYLVHTRGYNTFDVSDPAQPRLLNFGQTTQFGWKQIVLNGSGLGVAAVSPNQAFDGPHNISLYNVSNPASIGTFLTEFPTPGIARAVAIYNGIVYVADHNAGLQVINYLAADTRGVPPSVRLSTQFSGGVAEEGKFMRVTATVADDVQVRNVEFYIDGVRVATDGNFPFEHHLLTPRISQRPTFRLSARVSDTGGNFTWSQEVEIRLVQDATPPRVVRTSPANGGFNIGTSPVIAFWNESLNPVTVSSGSFRVSSAGPDGLIETADDVSVTGGTITYRDDIAATTIQFGTPLPGGTLKAVVGPPIADNFGNVMTTEFSWTVEVPREMTYGQTLVGTITEPGEKDAYVLIAAPGDRVRIRVNDGNSGAGIFPQFELFDAQSLIVTNVSDSYNAEAELVVATGGRHYLLISDAGAFRGGAYAVQLQKLNPPVGAVLLEYGQTTNGVISTFGEWDAYGFDTAAGDIVRIRVNDGNSGAGIFPQFELLDAQGLIVTNVSDSYNAEAELVLATGGRHYLLISDAGAFRGGAYAVQLQKLNPPTGAVLLEYGQTTNGVISTLGEWDAYGFDAAVGDIVRIRVNDGNSGAGIFPRFELLDAQGLILTNVSDSYNAEAELVLATGGRHYLLISDAGAFRGGAYAVQLQKLNPPAGAVLLEYGQTTNGVISTFGEWDAYGFDAAVGDIVRIRVNDGNSSAGIFPQFELFDAQSLIVTNVSDSYNAEAELVLATGGRHYLLISDAGAFRGGAYAVQLQKLNPPAGAVLLEYGQTTNGVISTFGEWDAYGFDTAAGDIVRIRVNDGNSSAGIFPRFELLDAQGLIVTNVSDSYNAEAELVLATGERHYLLISDAGAFRGGAYEISIQRLNVPPIGGTQIYANGFEGPVTAEWSTAVVDTTPAGGRKFLGQFGNEVVSLILTNIQAHTNATVVFDLFIIQSWDGNDVSTGPDVWDLTIAGGPTLLHTTFRNTQDLTQAYPDPYPGGDHPPRSGAIENDTLGYTFFGDSVYRLIFTVPHTATTVQFDFSASGLQELSDESWGIDNVAVFIK